MNSASPGNENRLCVSQEIHLRQRENVGLPSNRLLSTSLLQNLLKVSLPPPDHPPLHTHTLWHRYCKWCDDDCVTQRGIALSEIWPLFVKGQILQEKHIYSWVALLFLCIEVQSQRRWWTWIAGLFLFSFFVIQALLQCIHVILLIKTMRTAIYPENSPLFKTYFQMAMIMINWQGGIIALIDLHVLMHEQTCCAEVSPSSNRAGDVQYTVIGLKTHAEASQTKLPSWLGDDYIKLWSCMYCHPGPLFLCRAAQPGLQIQVSHQWQCHLKSGDMWLCWPMPLLANSMNIHVISPV